MKRQRGRWEKKRGSVGGKAKQVYVEKRKKQEEEGKQRRKQHKQEEAWWGLTFWGKHTKL